jgi:hypothetical protein
MGTVVLVAQAPAHVVQFYESDAYLGEVVAGFLAAGLGEGDTAVVIATEAHRLQLERRRDDDGFDVRAARAGGRYVSYDAADTLSRLMVDGWPDEARLRDVIGSALLRAGRRGRVRAFGEMVALLWDRRMPEAAVRLEQLWNGGPAAAGRRGTLPGLTASASAPTGSAPPCRRECTPW